MELPIGLKLALDYLDSKPWERKKMVALFSRGNTIIASFNNMKTHPIGARYDAPFQRTHAETSCLRQIRDAKGGNLYIIRRRGNQSLGDSRPCKACLRYVTERGIKWICYIIDGNVAWERLN